MKHYVIDPFGGETFLQNRIFDGPYDILRQMFRRRGIALSTYDLADIASAEKVLCFNYDPAFLDTCIRANIRKEQMALFMFEPSVIVPGQYDRKVWDNFGAVFTWRDDLVDNVRFHKLRYPQAQPTPLTLPAFEERRFLTLINANKYSYGKNELYSLRRQAIRFFERQDVEFDLYGFGWENGSKAIDRGKIMYAMRSGKLARLIKDVVDGRFPYSSFRGSISDKYEVLAGYRFNLCFENEQNAPGFVTEKLFDALHCGAIPIYLGAPNVTDYVPKDCFIDFREFSGFSDLLRYLVSMKAEDWCHFVDAGQRYLKSPAFDEWRPEAVFSSIVDILAPAP